MNINIEIDNREIQNQLHDLGYGKQVPFALSKSLNALGKIVQKDIRAGIESRFKLNRKTWVLNTIKINKENWANKNKLEITISVIDQAQFLKDMEQGGPHIPGFGRKLLALPNPIIFRGKPILKTNSLAIANLNLHKTPRGVEGDQGTYIIKPRNTAGLLKGLILQTNALTQKGKRLKGTSKSTNNRVLYTLISRTHRPAKLRFVITAQTSVQSNWQPAFAKNIQEAIRTARKKQ
jgi:hypothetical protein